MKSATFAACALLLVLLGVSISDGATLAERFSRSPAPAPFTGTSHASDPATLMPTVRRRSSTTPLPSFAHVRPASAILSNDALTKVVENNCASCHSERRKQGNLSLEGFDMATVGTLSPEVAEKMIGKLNAGMMPPPGRKRPEGDTLQQLASSLERIMDAKYAANPNPGTRAFQRLNRAEYQRSIHDLLGLDIEAASWLPLDTKSANFDNIADAQTPSAMLLDSYMDAASQISRLAVGDAKAGPTSQAYKVPRLASQTEPLPGAPRGTRGGVSVVHNFPADGEYTFAITLHAVPTGQLYGSAAPFDERIEVSVNGDRVAMLDIDRGMSQADPNGMDITTVRIPVRAGPQRVTATFLRTFEGPVNDVIAPIGHTIADTQIGAQGAITILPHLQEFTVTGPFNPTGVSDTPSRRLIFSCRPLTPAEARPCAESIVKRLAASAYRRPVNASDVAAIMPFYEDGMEEGGFELGVRTALEAILASPHFIFRIETVPEGVKPGTLVALDQLDLASRLSFFLWGSPPDSTLVSLARRGLLADTGMLVKQARRMLADSRSEALATRFAAQWLRLSDIEKVHPDALQYPDFHGQLADDMHRETELFFWNLVRDNGSVLRLLDADYSYMNELLAKHYGIPNVVGSEFRKVQYPDRTRTGLLGHASVLTLTSHANRTSPVLRGKWVMEVLMGTPPPPPPPDVPDLEAVAEAKEGIMLTTRQRMEAHRENPSCKSCHVFIDPIGLALDNFDVTGRWRIRENGAPLDTRGDFYDGTPISTPAQLEAVLLKRPVPITRNFTFNLMAYAVGRRMEYTDQPAIRRIERMAKANDYRIQEFIFGVVKSDAFRMKQLPPHKPTPSPQRPVFTAAAEVAASQHQRSYQMNFLSGKAMPRRHFLQGMSATIALPYLNAMMPTGRGAWRAANNAPRLVAIEMVHGAAGCNELGAKMNLWSPAATGSGFDLSPTAMQALDPYRQHLTIISNTDVRNAEPTSPEEIGGDHFRSSATFLTQMHPKQTEGSDVKVGVSLDQMYAKQFGQDTPIPSMQLCIENVDQAGGCAYGYACVYTDSISWASEDEPLPVIRDPRVAFEKLFGVGGSAQERAERRRTRRSILDFVSGEMSSLRSVLGPEDKYRLERYMDDIREVERRIQMVEARNTSGDPREIPEAPAGVPDSFAEHVKLMFDIQALAFAADVTRVFSFKMGRDGSSRVYAESGTDKPFHPASHHGGTEKGVSDFHLINKYHVAMLPYFLDKLSSITEGDSTMLDKTMIIYGSPMGDSNLHNHRRCPLIVLGHANGQLPGNQHIKAPDGTPMANAMLSMMHTLGMNDVTSFGDSTNALNLTAHA